MLPGLQIRSKSENSGAAISKELQHLHWIPEIEMKDLVGIEDVHLRERSRFSSTLISSAVIHSDGTSAKAATIKTWTCAFIRLPGAETAGLPNNFSILTASLIPKSTSMKILLPPMK